MKKLVLTSAAILLFAAVAAAQDTKSPDNHPRESKKAIVLTGTVSSDAAILLSDKDHKAWKVVNPEALTDNAGEHVRVTARMAGSANEIVVTAAMPLDDATLTAKRDDSAFRR
jgi:hypothetical protein